MSRRAQGDPQAWYGGSKWNQWSPQLPRPRKDKKNKDQDKDKKVEGVLQSYDSMPLDSSTASSSSTGSDQQARAFMEAFFQYTKGQDLPEPLQGFFKRDAKEDLRSQQRQLNLHRNVLQKIEAKKRAIKKDEDQWQHWMKEVKDTIKQQKLKHEENMEKLQKELKELEQKEEEIRAGKENEESVPIEIEEDEDDIDELFRSNPKVHQEAVPEQENARIQQMKIALEQEYQRKLEEACHSAQMSMQQQMHMHMMALVGQPPPPPGMQFQQEGLMPQAGCNAVIPGTSGTEPAKVGPFTRKTRDREATSPYSRPKEDKETMNARLQETHGAAADEQKGEG